MTTEFERWMEKNKPQVHPNTFAWYLAADVWRGRGNYDAAIARGLNSPRVAGVLADEIGQVHD